MNSALLHECGTLASNEILDNELSDILASSYWEMPADGWWTAYFFQVVNVNNSGKLSKIELHPPICAPWSQQNCPGCCDNGVVRVKIYEYDPQFASKTPPELNLLGYKDVAWTCGSDWFSVDFSDLNIYFNAGDKFIIVLDPISPCQNVGGKCWNEDDPPGKFTACYGVCVARNPEHIPCGFWQYDNRYGFWEIKTWPGERGNGLAFRSYIIPETPPSGGAKGDIVDIQWFPDHPDKKLPPNTEIRICQFTVANVGDKAGTINIKMYYALVGETDWQLAGSTSIYLAPNGTYTFNAYATTPSSGTMHWAVVAYANEETEPSLPPASSCPT